MKPRCGTANLSRVRASEIREMRSMTASLHWATGETRPDGSFATSQFAQETVSSLGIRSQAGSTNRQTLEKSARNWLEVQTPCRQRRACFRAQTPPFTTQMQILTEGSDHEWLTETKHKGIRSMVCWSVWWLGTMAEGIPISFMTWKSNASRRTIFCTFGAEANACRDALDLAEHTRAMLCEVVIGGEVLPDEWKGEHLPIRVITDCKSLFDVLAKDASVLEDRGTALTVASLRERCSPDVGRDQHDVWNRLPPRGKYKSPEEETNYQPFERS